MSNGGEITIELTLDGKQMQLGVKNAGDALRQLQRTLGNTAASVKRMEEAQFSLSTKFRHLIVTLGNLRFAAMDVHDVFLRLPIAIMKSAGELERTQQMLKGLSTGFTEVARSANAAKDFNFIKDMAQSAPYDISSLSDAFVKLKTGGLDPTKGSMQALVDSAAKFGASSEQFKRAGVAIQQMLGKNVVSMEELRQQLGEAIPSAMQDMATGMGVSMAELTKRVGKGTVEASSAIEKMTTVMAIRNQGAADAMMNTWTGVTSQLKTQMELTAAQIADAGFGDAMKTGVKDLVAYMKTDDFKRFAIDVGTALSQVVEGIRSAIQFFREWGDTIGLVVKGFIAYKVASSFLVPMLQGIQLAGNKVIAGYKAQAVALNEKVAAERRAAIESATLASQSAQAAQTAAAATVAARQQEVAQLRVANAQVLADYQRLNTALASARGGVAVPGQAGFQSRNAVTGQVAQLGATYTANAAAIRAANQEMNAAKAAMAAAGVAAATAATQTTALGSAATGAGAGMRAASVAATAARGVFNLLGGPIGLITIALTLGVTAWLNYAQKAEESAQRVMRAKKLMSSEKDAGEFKGEMEKAQAKVTQTQQAMNFAIARGWQNSPVGSAQRNEFEKLNKAFKEAQGSLSESSANYTKATIAVTKSRARDNAEAIMAGVKTQTDTINKGYQEKLAAQESVWAKEADDAKKGNKKVQTTEKQKRDFYAEIGKKQNADLLSVVEKQRTAQQALLKGPNGETASAAIQMLEEQAAQYKEGLSRATTLTNDVKPLTVKDPNAGKGGGAGPQGPIQTKLQKLITDLKASKADLDAQLPGVMDSAGKADTAAGAYAKIMEKWKEGAFDFYGPKPKKGKAAVVRPSEETAKQAAALARDNRIAEDSIKALENIKAKAEQIRPEVTAALEFLANPYDSEKAGAGQTNSLAMDKYIATLPKAASITEQAFGKQAAAIAEFRKSASALDTADVMRTVVGKNKDMSLELIEDDQRRNIERIRLDNELTQKMLQNAIDRAKAVGDTGGAKMLEAELAKNVALGAQSVAKASRTPMQELLADWQNTTKQMQQASTQWANGTIDAFVNMAQTGKFEWKGLVTQILADILRIQAQKAMGNAINSAITFASSFFADGGIMSSAGSMPLKQYAAGGIANSPQMAIFGEGDSPEAYVPLPDGRSIPVTMSGAAGGAAPNVTFNLINQTGQQVQATQQGARFDGKAMILDVVLSAMSQPGQFRDGARQALK